MIITRPIGIDLGTTNSAIAMLDLNGQDLILYKDAQGRSTIPSCVWTNPKSGERVIGHKAYARKGITPEPISSIKRSMGTQMTLSSGGKQCTPAEISACILTELKLLMDSELHKRAPSGIIFDTGRAIVTVPAYFGLASIEATRLAGEIAGFEVMELLHEPTAAAIYYSWKHDLGDGLYMVYDYGGGTFDVSILQKISGEFLVLGISGDIFLGGDDFDRRLAEYLKNQIIELGYDFELDTKSDQEDRIRFNQLMHLAERAKKELSVDDEIILKDQGTIRDKQNIPVIIDLPLNRTLFENLVSDLIGRTITFCEDALKKARQKGGVSFEQIDYILLVGGSTYVPAVQRKIKEVYLNTPGEAGTNPQIILDEPETAVALGAALRASALGVGIGDDTRDMRIWLNNSTITRKRTITLSGIIEPLNSPSDLKNCSIRLKNRAGDQLLESPIKEGLKFSFPNIDLTEGIANLFTFEIFNQLGDVIWSIEYPVVQADSRRDSVGGTLSTAVLSKPILLEGTDGDHLVRTVLLADGESLPAKATFIFHVSDSADRIRLPIYQENRIIKELVTDIGKVESGTPVEITICCDAMINIKVNFKIGDVVYSGTIDPPPPDEVPTEHEIQKLSETFIERIKKVDDSDSEKFIEQYNLVQRDIAEARSGGDFPKIIQRKADLEGLIREVRLAEPLKPPLGVLESKYSSAKDMIARREPGENGKDLTHLEKELDLMIQMAREAYKYRNRQQYDDASVMLDTTFHYISIIAKPNVIEQEDMDIAVRASMAIEQVSGMTGSLLLFSLVSGNHEYAETLTNQMAEIEQMKEKVTEDPAAILKRCQLIISDSQRIYSQLFPDKKDPSEFEGLLKIESGKKGIGGLAGPHDFMLKNP